MFGQLHLKSTSNTITYAVVSAENDILPKDTFSVQRPWNGNKFNIFSHHAWTNFSLILTGNKESSILKCKVIGMIIFTSKISSRSQDWFFILCAKYWSNVLKWPISSPHYLYHPTISKNETGSPIRIYFLKRGKNSTNTSKYQS